MLDVRVGKIVEVWNHPDSEKLFCEKIDVGEAEPREIASGLRAHYTLEQLKDRSVLVVCNLKAAKLAGFESSGMVFCASSSDKGVVEFVDPPVGAAPGDRMLTQSEFAAPATSNQMKKKKFMEKIGAELKTDGEKLATYMGEPLVVGGERCTAPTVAGGSIS
ncbi:hypothetical protein T492DRAFT_591584 [Pavlovales sp. CCMP2436]|nr:hypothetical protein T492DRAFT_591584 [Pavlovales sp. CCMP2436]